MRSEIEALKAQRSSLIIAPTHGECRAIASAVRKAMKEGSSLFRVGNIRTRVDPERFAAVNQEAGITRFARPSALIPFLV